MRNLRFGKLESVREFQIKLFICFKLAVFGERIKQTKIGQDYIKKREREKHLSQGKFQKTGRM